MSLPRSAAKPRRQPAPRHAAAGAGNDKVRHVGQPVALVVAETLAQARDAAEAIVVDYEELPAVVDARAQSSRAHRSCSTAFPAISCSTGTTTPAISPPRGGVRAPPASPRSTREQPRGGELDGATQRRRCLGRGERPTRALHGQAGSHFVRDPLAEQVLKLPKEKVRLVTPPNVGGGFGMKAFLYPEQAAVLWASKLKRPVKWQSKRAPKASSPTTRAAIMHARGARARRQRALPGAVSTIANLGAYLTQMGSFIDALYRPAVGPLHDPGDRRQREGCVHQHRSGLRLSRRRPA